MRIKDLHIYNLRNHVTNTISFSQGLNVIRGPNGSGKTTILEAISIASLSKTFLPTSDLGLIRNGENSFIIKILAESLAEVDYKVGIEYKSGGRKRINTSIGENQNPKDIIGIIPVVILSPDYKALTFGSPSDRRQFLDTVLSQSSKIYVGESIKYKKILRQRNALLSQSIKDGKIDKDVLEILTDQMISSGAEIIYRRVRFINEFKPIFIQSYLEISSNSELPDIIYEPDHIKLKADENSKDYYSNELLNSYKRLSVAEQRRGTTLFGPHRDDLTFTINGLNSKDSASQGQHKSLLIAIKLAEFDFLSNILNETPIILFDDIFSELDFERSNAVFERIVNYNAQTIITMTNSERLMDHFHNIASYFDVSNGKVGF